MSENGAIISGAETEQPFELSINELSSMLSRAALAGRAGLTFSGERDLYTALGYIKLPTFDRYQDYYQRGDIAGNIVDAPALDTWRNTPEFLDGVDEKTARPDTKFVKAIKQLDKDVGLFAALSNVDRLTGIGRYGILVFGFAVNPAVSQITPGDFESPIDDSDIEGLIYLRGFSEGKAVPTTYITDPTNPKFGLPRLYTVDFGEGVGAKNVHHTRIIHITEDNLEDRVYGRPRLRRILNRLDDLQKIVGGGAEAFWRNVDRGIKAKVDDGYNLGPEDEEALREDISAFMHKFQRFILTEGVSLDSMGADYADPSGLFGVVIDLIAAASGIPKRILLGSERGELASSQDETNWNKIVRWRQTKFAEPEILRPVIDRLISSGVLPPPESGEYVVKWPDLFELSDAERADIAGKVADALSKLVLGGGAEIIDVAEFVTKYLRLSAVDIVELISIEETEEPPEPMPAEEQE